MMRKIKSTTDELHLSDRYFEKEFYMLTAAGKTYYFYRNTGQLEANGKVRSAVSTYMLA